MNLKENHNKPQLIKMKHFTEEDSDKLKSEAETGDNDDPENTRESYSATVPVQRRVVHERETKT